MGNAILWISAWIDECVTCQEMLRIIICFPDYGALCMIQYDTVVAWVLRLVGLLHGAFETYKELILAHWTLGKSWPLRI